MSNQITNLITLKEFVANLPEYDEIAIVIRNKNVVTTYIFDDELLNAINYNPNDKFFDNFVQKGD